jgi:hypothetical protein
MAAAHASRSFAVDNPELFAVMFSQPFEMFQPSATERRSGETTRTFVVDQVQRCIDASRLSGDAVDIAHVLLALMTGLAGQETASWLGSSDASRDRRWDAGLAATMKGFR